MDLGDEMSYTELLDIVDMLDPENLFAFYLFEQVNHAMGWSGEYE